MNEPSSLLDGLPEDAVFRLEEVCCRFEQSWQAGNSPRPEDYLDGAEGVERLAVLRELLRLDLCYRRRAGEGPSAQDYARRFPEAAALLTELFSAGTEPSRARAEDTAPDAERTGPHLGSAAPGRDRARRGAAARRRSGSAGAPLPPAALPRGRRARRSLCRRGHGAAP